MKKTIFSIPSLGVRRTSGKVFTIEEKIKEEYAGYQHYLQGEDLK